MSSLTSFDADGRRHPPRHDITMYAVIGALVVVPAVFSVGVAWILRAGLSPWRITVGLLALATGTALFTAWEWAHQQERRELHDELVAQAETIAHLHAVCDDATGMTGDPRTAA